MTSGPISSDHGQARDKWFASTDAFDVVFFAAEEPFIARRAPPTSSSSNASSSSSSRNGLRSCAFARDESRL